MFFRILKKDLKRKKTMNVILLLFVIMSSMFAAAAVNNINAVTGGVEHFFNEAGVKDVLDLRIPWQVKDYMLGMRNFSARKTMSIIAAIRETDAKSKGFGNSMATSGELLQELIYFILH